MKIVIFIYSHALADGVALIYGFVLLFIWQDTWLSD